MWPLKGFDQFDPSFFNISPREAEMMDPQERVFLQCVYSAVEDAGYTPGTLSRSALTGIEQSVGVYVGVVFEEYQLFRGDIFGPRASIANRVSYFCNFCGPSIAIDTMCSSSLTAIHLACQSLKSEECSSAIAGGVNLSLHPNKYLMLARLRMASPKGRCRAFGEGGDGYVPAEGVGAVVLKTLSNALADGDHIYGVIQATAINQCGKTRSYLSPSPSAQTAVIQQAFKIAGINPRIVSYVEAHGTGTSLGDPIEIAGLTKAFRQYTEEKPILRNRLEAREPDVLLRASAPRGGGRHGAAQSMAAHPGYAAPTSRPPGPTASTSGGSWRSATGSSARAQRWARCRPCTRRRSPAFPAGRTSARTGRRSSADTRRS